MTPAFSFLSPTLILLILILLLLFVYWIMTFIIFYHLVRFGIGNQPKKFVAVFLLGSIGLFFMSTAFLFSIDVNSTKDGLARLVGTVSSMTHLQ